MAEIQVDIEKVNPDILQGMADIETVEPEPVVAEPVAAVAPEPVPAPAAEPPKAVETEIKIETTAAPGATPQVAQPSNTAASPVDISSKLKAIFGEDVDSEQKAIEMLNSLKNQPPAPEPWANDYVKGLNDYLKNGGTKDVYDRVMSVDIDKLSPFDAQKTLMLWENPELNEEDVVLALKDKYRQGEDEDETEKRIGSVHMTSEGRVAKQRLVDLQNKYSVPEPARAQSDFIRGETERLNSWEGKAHQIVSEMQNIELPLSENEVIKFASISEGTKSEVIADIQSAIKHSGIPMTPENVGELKRVATERVLIREFPSILKAIKASVETSTEARVRAEYSNPSPVQAGDPVPARGKTPEEVQFEKTLARLKQGRIKDE